MTVSVNVWAPPHKIISVVVAAGTNGGSLWSSTPARGRLRRMELRCDSGVGNSSAGWCHMKLLSRLLEDPVRQHGRDAGDEETHSTLPEEACVGTDEGLHGVE